MKSKFEMQSKVQCFPGKVIPLAKPPKIKQMKSKIQFAKSQLSKGGSFDIDNPPNNEIGRAWKRVRKKAFKDRKKWMATRNPLPKTLKQELIEALKSE